MATAPEPNAQASTSSPKPIVLPPMTVQQEDSIIHTRITNDEKALRRVTKKFHTYAAVAYDSVVPPPPAASSSVDDARDAFLVELASFHLSLRKSLMVCEAEARQVEEYQREKERIETERTHLRDQIEELKLSLEHAQVQRRRKMEYDVIAEKVNALPTRDELEQSIRSLENDMAAIRAEHEDQTRILQAQQAALDVVITSIQDLRLMGKQDPDVVEESQDPTPPPETQTTEGTDVDMDASQQTESGEILETADESSSKDASVSAASSAKVLNPAAQPFVPHADARTATPQQGASTPASQQQAAAEADRGEQEEGEMGDIEMGELAEEPEEKPAPKKKVREELEEGEASDSDLGSELTDLSDVD